MTKVYPNLKPNTTTTSEYVGTTVTLTVWKKSLLFNCNGFTVYDDKGNIVFRVDNYVAGIKGQILLMDASGTPLLTIRRKRLSLGDHWFIYDEETSTNPLYSVKKLVNLLPNNSRRSLANIVSGCKNMAYQIAGSYAQRSCAVYTESDKKRVVELMRKEVAGGVALGADVFRLVVEPKMEPALAMAFVIALDQMFPSSSLLHRLTP